MEERHLVSTGARTWFLVDEAEPARFQVFEGRGDIDDSVRNVM
jgi:hypothetical protein